MKTLAIKFKGKPIDFNPASPMIGRLVKLLDSLPDDEVFDRTEIASRLGSTPTSVSTYRPDPKLKGYTVRHRCGILWGSKKAIALFIQARDANAAQG